MAWLTSVGRHVPPDRLARVFSYDMLGSFVAIPVGQVAAGPLAAAIGTRDTLLALAAAVVLAVAGMLGSRDVRRLTVPPIAEASQSAAAAAAGAVET